MKVLGESAVDILVERIKGNGTEIDNIKEILSAIPVFDVTECADINFWALPMLTQHKYPNKYVILKGFKPEYNLAEDHPDVWVVDKDSYVMCDWCASYESLLNLNYSKLVQGEEFYPTGTMVLTDKTMHGSMLPISSTGNKTIIPYDRKYRIGSGKVYDPMGIITDFSKVPDGTIIPLYDPTRKFDRTIGWIINYFFVIPEEMTNDLSDAPTSHIENVLSEYGFSMNNWALGSIFANNPLTDVFFELTQMFYDSGYRDLNTYKEAAKLLFEVLYKTPNTIANLELNMTYADFLRSGDEVFDIWGEQIAKDLRTKLGLPAAASTFSMRSNNTGSIIDNLPPHPLMDLIKASRNA